MSGYVSHIILLPQSADWPWYEALRPYIERYKVTITKSADDAGSFYGARHTVTIVQPPGAWPDGIIPFFQQRYPHARLDYLLVQDVNDLRRVVSRRLEEGRRYGRRLLGPFGEPPAGPSTYDSHILLLPHGSDWRWYEAVREYVLHFRVTVAQSADDAGSFHGRNHVVTAVVYPGAWGGDDIIAWLQERYPQAQTQRIAVESPEALSRRLKARVVHEDRFGQGEPYEEVVPPEEARPFRMRWPLDPALITRYGPPWAAFSRHFAASPWDYRPYLPGHEGLDFLAPHGEVVYACADGIVAQLDRDPSHLSQPGRFPYGFFVRIRHTHGDETYETLYAHLSEVLVDPNAQVSAGQPIGRVGATGRTTGPHLHLNLKRLGRPPEGYPYPPGYPSGTLLDPLRYLEWPDGWVLTPDEELPHLYGVHEDYEGPEDERKAGYLMEQAGVRGYILWSEAIGADPDDTRGVDYRQRTYGDHVVIVRLNYSYAGHQPDGTLPPPEKYEDFATRCYQFARNSQGAHIYVVGNEMNNPREWPNGQPIWPEEYARCFNLVYRRIKEADPEAIVCPGAIDPYHASLAFAPYNSPYGDIRKYWRTMLEAIEACDGLAIHAYTHGPDPRLLEDTRRVFTAYPLEGVRYHFWVFEDVLQATPERFRHLPVYLTETTPLFKTRDEPAWEDADKWGWPDVNEGWIWTMYQQVDAWNKRGGQQIHCALLYRYPPKDRWVIYDKPRVIEDFTQALGLKFRPYKPRERLE